MPIGPTSTFSRDEEKMAEEGRYSSKDIVKGKIKPDEIRLKYIMVYDTGGLKNLAKAINKMAEEGWVVRGCAGVSGGAFVILEKT